jgi:hypothetical protein
MLSPSEAADITHTVANFIETHGIKFERGEPREYFAKLTRLHTGFTLPIVSREQLATAVLLKNFYGLWNIIVDDEVDREGLRTHLDASVQLLLCHSRGEEVHAPSSSAARTLQEILAKLPQDASKAHLRELFLFDLWDLMTGFRYESCINRVTRGANSLEYGKYSTMTASIKQFLDLDCLFATNELPSHSYRTLRVAYEHLAVALKFASDVGSLKRELVDEDNLNLVRILALEEGVPELERKLENEAQYEAILPRIEPLLTKVRQQAQAKLESARSLLDKVPEVDTRQLLASLTKVIEIYCKCDDPFFHKTDAPRQ